MKLIKLFVWVLLCLLSEYDANIVYSFCLLWPRLYRKSYVLSHYFDRYSGPSPAVTLVSFPVLKEPHLRNEKHFPLVVDLKDRECSSSVLVGGKGSALALMTSLDKNQVSINRHNFCYYYYCHYPLMFSTDCMILWESLFNSSLSCLSHSPPVLVHFAVWEKLNGYFSDLLSDTAIILDCIVANGKMINEWCDGRDVEGNGLI